MSSIINTKCIHLYPKKSANLLNPKQSLACVQKDLLAIDQLIKENDQIIRQVTNA